MKFVFYSMVNPFMPRDLLDKCRLDLGYFSKYFLKIAFDKKLSPI